SQLKTGHPVRSAIHKQLNGRLVLRWVTTWESLLLYVLHFSFAPSHHCEDDLCHMAQEEKDCNSFYTHKNEIRDKS
ncbi:hypothetical protein KCU81_g9870, partial [Aureobasidium melanogenum]